jgi:DNA polymerase
LRDGRDPYKYMAAANTGKEYDEIADEGDDRQLGKAQVLGCGFGMGATKFQTTAWDMYRLKLTIDQARFAVASYRTANKPVTDLWKAYEKAAVAAVETDKFLWAQLPSGRRLAYREPQTAWRETDYGPRKGLEFLGLDKSKRRLALERTWGGTLTENIVQATARDLMMPAMVRLEKVGYKALLMVHDEGICEKPIGTGTTEEFVRILTEPPPWAKGLPLEAKGWCGPRYRK